MATADNLDGRNVKRNRPAVLSKAAWILLGLAFLAAIVIDAFFSDSGILQVWQLERNYKQTVKEIRDIEKENIALQHKIEELEARPDAVEDVAREDLGFVKPGEEVYIFPQEMPKVEKKPVSSSDAKQKASTDTKR